MVAGSGTGAPAETCPGRTAKAKVAGVIEAAVGAGNELAAAGQAEAPGVGRISSILRARPVIERN